MTFTGWGKFGRQEAGSHVLPAAPALKGAGQAKEYDHSVTAAGAGGSALARPGHRAGSALSASMAVHIVKINIHHKGTWRTLLGAVSDCNRNVFSLDERGLRYCNIALVYYNSASQSQVRVLVRS